jgi:hypothetical protein
VLKVVADLYGIHWCTLEQYPDKGGIVVFSRSGHNGSTKTFYEGLLSTTKEEMEARIDYTVPTNRSLAWNVCYMYLKKGHFEWLCPQELPSPLPETRTSLAGVNVHSSFVSVAESIAKRVTSLEQFHSQMKRLLEIEGLGLAEAQARNANRNIGQEYSSLPGVVHNQQVEKRQRPMHSPSKHTKKQRAATNKRGKLELGQKSVVRSLVDLVKEAE